MYIRSTGLGRTLLTCHVDKIEVTNVVPSTLEAAEDGQKEPTRLLMTIKTTSPVTWTVRGFVEPEDLWIILRAAMRPAVIWTGIKFLLFGSKKKPAPANASQSTAEATN